MRARRVQCMRDRTVRKARGTRDTGTRRTEGTQDMKTRQAKGMQCTRKGRKHNLVDFLCSYKCPPSTTIFIFIYKFLLRYLRP